MKAKANRDDGLRSAESQSAVRRRVGNSARLKELSREAWGWGFEAFREDLLRRASSVPGVLNAGTVSILPLGQLAGHLTFEVEGRTVTSDNAAVSTGYLRAIGKRIEIDGIWFTTVGIVKDVRQDKPDSEPAAAVYELARQMPEETQDGINGRYMVLVLRTVGQASWPVQSAIRAAVAEIDKDQPVADIKTMEERIAGSLAGRRLNTLLLSIFAGLAVALAAVGVFGVVSYSVTQRTSEIGVRMALGARPVAVLAMVAGETLLLGLIGVGLGVGGTLASSRLLAGFLYGVTPADPGIVIAVAAVLVGVVVASGLIPARRAMKVDPVVALRE